VALFKKRKKVMREKGRSELLEPMEKIVDG